QLPEAFDGFDYPAYLARQNIFATVFADTVQHVSQPSLSLWSWGDRLRQRLLQQFREAMPPKLAAMAQSLMLGDRSALPADTEEAFSRTGLMHLLAVSGLHLGIFLGGAWWGLRRMGLRPRCAYPLVGMLVLLALVVVGPRVSLVRAGLLFAFLALGSVLADCGVILRRWIHPLNGLAAAAIAILLMRPGALFDAGFQLTMAATGAILLAFSPSGWATRLSNSQGIEKLWRGWQWLIRLLIVSGAAQAGAAPVIAWHFEAFHPLSVLVNLAAIPLATLSLWAGLLSVVFSATPLFAITVLPFAWLLKGLESLVGTLARSPMVELTVIPTLGIWMAGCIGFVYLASFYVWLSSRTSNSTSIESGSSEVS
ncbi:ComEC/Rec2 family competence protein, partial [Candidatus Bipolaricaulota bacterium]|nr:ComEC/Rec2 family competence protein [Candidatus Bipolaricaulota bacterium]